ncbi:hypothetical protein [Polyangium jinanense]|nr:hypothetical protein [Polyangium jinanense]
MLITKLSTKAIDLMSNNDGLSEPTSGTGYGLFDAVGALPPLD